MKATSSKNPELTELGYIVRDTISAVQIRNPNKEEIDFAAEMAVIATRQIERFDRAQVTRMLEGLADTHFSTPSIKLLRHGLQRRLALHYGFVRGNASNPLN